MILDFTGKTIAISGAAIGFGRAIADRFAAAGAEVFGCDILDADAADAERISISKVDLLDRGSDWTCGGCPGLQRRRRRGPDRAAVRGRYR
jgi:3-oxoacyl-[acyl-carrier protein] reductase